MAHFCFQDALGAKYSQRIYSRKLCDNYRELTVLKIGETEFSVAGAFLSTTSLCTAYDSSVLSFKCHQHLNNQLLSFIRRVSLQFKLPYSLAGDSLRYSYGDNLLPPTWFAVAIYLQDSPLWMKHIRSASSGSTFYVSSVGDNGSFELRYSIVSEARVLFFPISSVDVSLHSLSFVSLPGWKTVFVPRLGRDARNRWHVLNLCRGCYHCESWSYDVVREGALQGQSSQMCLDVLKNATILQMACHFLV